MLPSTPAAQELPAAAPNPPPASPVAIAPPVPVPPPLMQTPFDKAYQEGLRAEKNGDNEKAFAAYRQAAQLDPNNVDAKERLEQVRRKLVSSYTYAARTAFAKQDLDSAIHNWEQVLVIDPANETAKLERQKTITLREKLQGIPTSSH
jgi:tetratricopeptide (TPR) repeat protein